MKKANLAAETVNKYVKYVKQVVASLKDGATGEPIHHRKWDSAVLDLPVVNQKAPSVAQGENHQPTSVPNGSFGPTVVSPSRLTTAASTAM
jgi:hypothetical protein